MVEPIDSLTRPDRTVLIDVHEAKRAFVSWRKDWPRPENIDPRQAPREFARLLARRLDLKTNREIADLGIPLSDTAWSRLKNETSAKRLRLDVCWQIYFLNRIDVTANKELMSYPLNSTDMVVLGKCESQSHDVATGAKAVKVSWVILQSTDEKRVLRADALRDPTNRDFEEVIGSVRFLLRNCHVTLRNCAGIEPVLKRVGDGRPSEYGAADGLSVNIDPREQGCWRLERGAGASAIQGRCDDLYLANIISSDNLSTTVEVSASIADVLPEMDIVDGSLTTTHLNRLRDQLVQQVMRSRLRDGGLGERFVLSIAHIDT